MSRSDQSAPGHEQITQWRNGGLLAAMRDIGLPASVGALRSNGATFIDIGFEFFVIYPKTVGIFTSEDETTRGCVLAIDIALQDPHGLECYIIQSFGEIGFHDGNSDQEVLHSVTRKWTQGVLAPLCRLYGEENGPLLGRMKLQSYTEGDAQMTLWEGFVGQAQFWGNMSEVSQVTAPNYVNQALTHYLHEKSIHYVEVEGICYENGTTKFEVTIDNRIDERAGAEAAAKFDWTPYSAGCAFRQFFVVRPCGNQPLSAANENLAHAMTQYRVNTTLRASEPHLAPAPQTDASQPPAPSKKAGLSLPFGKRRSVER